MQTHVPDHLQKLIHKIEEEESKGNCLTDAPEVVPPISVAARVVQVRSSSNEQSQCKEQHTNSVHHSGTPETIKYESICDTYNTTIIWSVL